MKAIYQQLWQLAKPYYEKGRQYDVPHIEWMMGHAVRIAKQEKVNEKLLLPICILHDVGYGVVTQEKNPGIKNQEIKKAHMIAGAKIADQLLREVRYDDTLREQIVHYISVHDNWVFGDSVPFHECKEMALFNDLDFLWATSSFEVFKTLATSMKLHLREFYEVWKKEEKLVNRPLCCDATKKMWEESMKEIKEQLNG